LSMVRVGYIRGVRRRVGRVRGFIYGCESQA